MPLPEAEWPSPTPTVARPQHQVLAARGGPRTVLGPQLDPHLAPTAQSLCLPPPFLTRGALDGLTTRKAT